MSDRRTLPRFENPGAELERFGFDDGRFGASRLPGPSWEEGNMFNGARFMPNCNMEEAVFNDTVWQFGDGNHGRLDIYRSEEDKVLLDLFYSDAVRRLQAVEQLTLPPEYTTIPNTGAFSRFEHIWGSVLFVRQIADNHGITGRDSIKLQLRTLVSDFAQTFGSHLGDWTFQGVGGPENEHDIGLYDYLDATGINEILRHHNYDPADIIFPDITDLVEAPLPDLCDDRVDYGLREMNRWNDVVWMEHFSTDDFEITPENMLAMVDQQRARIFSEGYLLLSQEHWSEPTHRFLLDMLMLRTRLFYAEGGAPRSWVFTTDERTKLIPLQDIHPRDLMYVTDPAQAEAYALPNKSGHILEAIMKNNAQYRRQYVWPGRKERINKYMRQFSEPSNYKNILGNGVYKPLEDPSFNSYLDEYPKTLPGGVAILDEKTARDTKDDDCIDFHQNPFKVRQIDPLVRSGNGYKRLSELDPSYAHRLKEHAAALAKPKVSRLKIADPETAEIVKAIVENVDEAWQKRLDTSRRMEPHELKSLVSTASTEIFGRYPFMTFLEY